MKVHCTTSRTFFHTKCFIIQRRLHIQSHRVLGRV